MRFLNVAMFEVIRDRKKFCSNKCSGKSNFRSAASRAGLASAKAQAITRRSKNEICFAELCKTKFKSVRENVSIFNGWDADVVIDDLKIAVLWNGKWHYEKITKRHSVEQVQNRDRIKLKEIEIAGYESYVIKDLGKFNRGSQMNKIESNAKIVQRCDPIEKIDWVESRTLPEFYCDTPVGRIYKRPHLEGGVDCSISALVGDDLFAVWFPISLKPTCTLEESYGYAFMESYAFNKVLDALICHQVAQALASERDLVPIVREVTVTLGSPRINGVRSNAKVKL